MAWSLGGKTWVGQHEQEVRRELGKGGLFWVKLGREVLKYLIFFPPEIATH